MRAWVETWKRAGIELDRMKWEQLRRLSEAQAARDFCMLDCDPVLIWRSPEREDGAGLVEQQRWFMKAHGALSRPDRRA